VSRSLKLFIGGAVAVVVLAFAAVAFLSRLQEPPVVASAPPPVSGAGGVAAEPTRPEPPTAVQFQASPPPASKPQAPIAAELRNPWDTVPIVGRGRTGFARDLDAAVTELQPDVAACFRPEVRGRFAGSAVAEYRGQDAADQLPDPTLMLELEARSAELLIVDAPVETRGNLSDDILACAQQTVRGKRLAVEGANPGSRYKARLPVAP
jgi:hypothetical protein